MYRVVGCSECSALWVIEGDPETSECPRCGSRRRRDRRRTFFESEDPDEAREARARLLADRQDAGDAFAAVDDFASLADATETAGPDDETYLAESGVDPDAVAAAGERAEGDASGRSREETVRAAIRDSSAPAAADIEQYCEAHGVPADAARRLLDKLERAGEVTQDDGAYRLL